MLIAHMGKEKSLVEWAKEKNMSQQALLKRLQRKGWTVADAIEKPFGKQPSKNDAELYLNDLTMETLPEEFRVIFANKKQHGKKYGHYIRSEHRAQFDRWFKESYLADQSHWEQHPQ